jgi:acetamidase/formamidase
VIFSPPAKGLDRHAADQPTSIAGDVAIAQLVDGKVGVHVKMPRNIFKR